MNGPTVQARAAAVAKQRALAAAELAIARELPGYEVACSEDGPTKTAKLYRENGTLAAVFQCLTWNGCIGAAKGWSEVAR